MGIGPLLLALVCLAAIAIAYLAVSRLKSTRRSRLISLLLIIYPMFFLSIFLVGAFGSRVEEQVLYSSTVLRLIVYGLLALSVILPAVLIVERRLLQHGES